MNALEEALYDKLAGATAVTDLVSTRIYRGMAPQNAALPYLIIQLQGGGDDNWTPTESKSYVYSVRAVSQVSTDEAGDIAEAVHTALHKQALTVSGWENYWMAAIGDLEVGETDPAGVRRWHRGQNYRIRLAQ